MAGIVQLLSFFLPLSLCHFDASPSLRLPSRHPIIFNFIYRDCQAKVFTNNIQVSPLIITNEMESETFWLKKKQIQRLKVQRNIVSRGGWSSHCTAVRVELFCAKQSAQLDVFSERVPVAHAEPSKVLNRKMQSVSENRAWARSLKSSHTLNFQSDSPWFNVSQLKATTLKGNQCNGFLASLLFLSPLWFPLVQTSSPLAIN